MLRLNRTVTLMEIRLYIVRHAHAEDGEPDFERPVSAKGFAQLRRVSKALTRLGDFAPDEIWHSGLKRSFETASFLKEALLIAAPLVRVENLAPNDHPASVADLASKASRSIMIVGHEPNLSRLASLVLTGGPSFERIAFQKASVLCLSRMKVGDYGTPWAIEWHIRPKLL